MRMPRLVAALMVVFLGLTTAAAQTDCPALVRAAIETAASTCEATGRNQLCYGHPAITAMMRITSEAAFGNPGDLLNVEGVQRLELSPMNLDDETWAVAMMNIQADLPASTSENVSLLLIGGAALDNLGDAVQIEARIVAPNAINVRSAPSTQGSIVSILDPGIPVTLNGRNAAGDWYHVQLGEGGAGWIVGYLVQADADLTALRVIDNDAPSYAPMQAFTLQTGMGDAGCAEAPNSGLLVQTPEAAGDNIQLQVNGVDFQLSGTAFLQAEAGNGLFVSILEGSGTLSALAKSVIVPAGAGSSVLIDENLLVNDVPADPTPYDPGVLQSLPLALLPRQIELIEPLRPRDITRLAGCRIVSESDLTNFREGPATAYFTTGTLDANRPYRVTGWTNGGDGFVWWRVSARQWVRVDLVTASGNCDSVAYAEDRPSQPTTSGYSTDLTCTSERVIYAEAGDIIPITDTYYVLDVPVGAVIVRFFVDGDMVYEGVGTASNVGITWSTTWVATAGIHNVEAQYTPTVLIPPDWAPGESASHKVCQIRVE